MINHVDDFTDLALKIANENGHKINHVFKHQIYGNTAFCGNCHSLFYVNNDTIISGEGFHGTIDSECKI